MLILRHIHLLNVFPLKPLLLCCGDFAQQQPIATIEGQVKQVTSIQHDKDILHSLYKFYLTKQFRVSGVQPMSLLLPLRF